MISKSSLSLVATLFFALLAVGSSDSSSSSQQEQIRTAVTAGQRAWYSGGSLHSAKMVQWSRAPYADRLATSADFVTTAMQQDGETIPPVDQLRPAAVALEACISETNKDGVADSQDAATVGATCWILMKQK